MAHNMALELGDDSGMASQSTAINMQTKVRHECSIYFEDVSPLSIFMMFITNIIVILFRCWKSKIESHSPGRI